MQSRFHFLMVLLAGASFAACFPEITYSPEKTSSTDTTTTTSSVGGMASTGGGGIGGTTATTSGAGGMEVGCDTLGEIGACGSGMKCTITNTVTGDIGCGPAGPKARGERCFTNDGECADGTWCDLQLDVCKPFCSNSTDCALDNYNGSCVEARKSNGGVIPQSRRHCRSHCDPISTNPCNGADTTCIYLVTEVEFDCSSSKNFIDDAICTDSRDCGPGLLCASGTCGDWCDNIDEACPTLKLCNGLNPGVNYDGTVMGICREL